MDNIQLTINDLNSIRGLIEAAYARGAYRINESELVGQVYNRLSLFIDQNTQPPIPDQGDQDA
jgi:hypothetical protein